MKLFIVVLSVYLVVSYGQKTCYYDHQCTLPYGYCDGGVDECSESINGLAIDREKAQIYFMQACRTDAYFRNITLKRVSASGGLSEELQTRVQIPAPGNPGIILGVALNELYYGIAYRTPGNTIAKINLDSLQETRGISTVEGFGFSQNVLEFGDGNTYVCNYLVDSQNPSYIGSTVQRIKGIISINGSSTQSLYKPALFNSCISLRRPIGSPYLYVSENVFTTNYTLPQRSKISRLEANCVPFNSTSFCPVQELFTVDQYVNDFDVYNDTIIYYGTRTGLYSRPISGSDTLVVSGVFTGVRIFNNRVFINNGVGIQSIPLVGGQLTQVNQAVGSCACKSGFSGDSCEKCDGVVQWNNNNPTCVAVENGVPTSCSASWQCGNVPFIECFGSCRCVSGFTGFPNCTTCDSPKVFLWSNGNPVCEE